MFGAWPVLTDGAWATELQKQGLPAYTPSDPWNLSNPEAVEALGRSYVEAGSRVLLTNTFRSNPVSLGEFGLERECGRLNRRAVELAHRATAGSPEVLIFGSIGPIRFVGPFDRAERRNLRTAFAAQVEALESAGVDALLCETFGQVEEAELAVELALESGLPTLISFSFGPAAVGAPPSAPISPEQCARRMAAAGVDAIGANCGTGSADAAGLSARLRSATTLPIWIKPNLAMRPVGPIDHASVLATVDFIDNLIAATQRGADFVGGCCGSTPLHIQALALRLADRPPRPGT